MEISAFLDKKLYRRFRTYDNDRDGYIEREDFELAAKRTGEEFGLAPDAPARQRLTRLLLDLWQHLATVADADGTLGLLNSAPARLLSPRLAPSGGQVGDFPTCGARSHVTTPVGES